MNYFGPFLSNALWYCSLLNSSFSLPKLPSRVYLTLHVLFSSNMEFLFFFHSRYILSSWLHHPEFLIQYMLPWSTCLHDAFVLVYFRIAFIFFISWSNIHRLTFLRLHIMPSPFLCSHVLLYRRLSFVHVTVRCIVFLLFLSFAMILLSLLIILLSPFPLLLIFNICLLIASKSSSMKHRFLTTVARSNLCSVSGNNYFAF